MAGGTEALPGPDQLFERARAGSVRAWEELYVVARPQLYRFARLRLATDHQAEDAVSETFVRAIAAAARYRPGPGVLPWLVGICRNVVREA
ncbi:MAG: sigma factor, partial [Acidimicrobiales bacterium]